MLIYLLKLVNWNSTNTACNSEILLFQYKEYLQFILNVSILLLSNWARKLHYWSINVLVLYAKITHLTIHLLWCIRILGDPGPVSRAGRKGATKIFKHGRKSPWVPTLTGPFPNGQANTGSWLGTKSALYYCAQSANNFSWVLFVSSYTTAIISPQLPGSFTKLS